MLCSHAYTFTTSTFGGSSGISRSFLQPDNLRVRKLTNLVMHTGILSKLFPERSSVINVHKQSRGTRKSLSDGLNCVILRDLRLGIANK